MKNYILIFTLFLVGIILSSCEQKKQTPPYNLDNRTKQSISIPYEEMGGVKVIPVKVNGVTMNMIYDTGCSGLHMSLNEVQTLAKNGKISNEDILDAEFSTIADGSIVQNGTLNIKEIVIGGKDGLILHNVKASVSLNQEAPVLLGNAVLDKLASVEVDNVEKTINFVKK